MRMAALVLVDARARDATLTTRCSARSSCRESNCDVAPESHGRLLHDNGRTSYREFL
jgi:hypothetical protein